VCQSVFALTIPSYRLSIFLSVPSSFKRLDRVTPIPKYTRPVGNCGPACLRVFSPPPVLRPFRSSPPLPRCLKNTGFLYELILTRPFLIHSLLDCSKPLLRRLLIFFWIVVVPSHILLRFFFPLPFFPLSGQVYSLLVYPFRLLRLTPCSFFCRFFLMASNLPWALLRSCPFSLLFSVISRKGGKRFTGPVSRPKVGFAFPHDARSSSFTALARCVLSHKIVALVPSFLRLDFSHCPSYSIPFFVSSPPFSPSFCLPSAFSPFLCFRMLQPPACFMIPRFVCVTTTFSEIF